LARETTRVPERRIPMAGRLVHFEIRAHDADRAQGFWSGLFGWEIADSGMPGMEYRVFRTGEADGGGLYADPDGVGHLEVYFDTDDIDASLATVRGLGGEAGEKTPIPHVGWFAACKDSEGNAFSLFQSDESAAG
jgi:predicted enzyme related to lactoylglutathione lyase